MAEAKTKAKTPAKPKPKTKPKPSKDRLFSNVVVAIDDSVASLGAIDAILPSVKAAGGKLAVVFVRHRPIMFDSVGVDSSNAWELLEESIEQREHDAERDATKRLSHTGIQATFVVREGDPAREILEVAKEHKATAVAIGSTVHGPIGSILVSSVTEYLLHHCAVPLVIIRSTD